MVILDNHWNRSSSPGEMSLFFNIDMQLPQPQVSFASILVAPSCRFLLSVLGVDSLFWFARLFFIVCPLCLWFQLGSRWLEVFLSGISTSLLFSAFESRMVSEHSHLGIGSQSLSTTFSHATAGNGVIAVVGGLGANLLPKFLFLLDSCLYVGGDSVLSGSSCFVLRIALFIFAWSCV